MPVTVPAGRPVASPSNAPFRKFATVPVIAQVAPSIVFVTPAITTFCTVAPEAMLSTHHVVQASFVFERDESAIVQLRMTEEPCTLISRTDAVWLFWTKRQFSARAWPLSWRSPARTPSQVTDPALDQFFRKTVCVTTPASSQAPEALPLSRV